ncbi:cation-translocating P-type ATPase [Chryseobacterium salivictor]|uniref:Calcium-transporting ATPase 1 n=1 Tax=Chryseobacterium salivictor TaxID=2547600 RepID=A0A4P6ZHG8_9FLAO|nr:cation-translocating P-type ATPase [Chryseobacterium salivictor]QBO59018.1 Calcium-transporting ATPase 1 [Chryseobacterium salivictor]
MSKEIQQWFTQSVPETLNKLSLDSDNGLSEAEALKRKELFGPNALKAKTKKPVYKVFLSQLKDWLIYILFAAVIITIFMGEYIDSGIIMLVILLNAAIGTYQEVKAGKAIEALLKMSSPKALVKRNGQTKEIDSAELVPGDLIILDAGRIIPADLRLLETVNLQIEESSLTGEAVPVLKNAAATFTDPNLPIADRENMAFMSTVVTAGRGSGIVVETGMNTEVGKIADLLDNDFQMKTPLEKKLSDLGKTLGKIAVGICIVIFGISWFQGRDPAEMFLISVSLAVASIPEGLAAIVAVVLSIGVTAMSKKNAIIRKLPAVETLGSVNIICSDKTGTFTLNKMTVTELYTADGLVLLDLLKKNTVSDSHRKLSEGMILCSDATLENDEATGDPTEIALLILGDQIGLDRTGLIKKNERIAENPFESSRKMMSVLIKSGNEVTVYTKGALDNLLKRVTKVYDKDEIRNITPEDIKNFRHAARKMSDNALRTLALAYKSAEVSTPRDQMEKDLVLIGLVGMIDPAREEVKPAVKLAKQAGIKTVMITGDHKNTALAIAKNLEVADNMDQVLTGPELDELSDEELQQKVGNYRVFARVSPQHKVKIVQAFQANGNVVSMTGDGVNDGPSLQIADIGVAMGITGTDVAKNAADMILTDDNFTTIVVAIEQGRNIFNNIKKSVLFLLTCNLGEVLAMFIPLSLGWPAPLMATQLLWINLLTDSLPAIALGMDAGDSDVMKDKPRKFNDNFFSNGAGIQVFLGGLLIGAITIFAFWYGFYEMGYSPFDKNIPEEVLKNSRTLTFLVLVFAQLFYSFGLRNSKKPFYQFNILGNKFLNSTLLLGIFLQLILLFIPVLRTAFKLHIPDAKGWIVALSLGIIPFIVLEISKIFTLKKN